MKSLLPNFFLALGLLASAAETEAASQPQPPATSPPRQEMQRLTNTLSGRWSISLTFEPSETMPGGGKGQGYELWRSGPGGVSILENYYSTASEGEVSGLGLAWWDEKAQRYEVAWCEGTNPEGCTMLSNGAIWEVDRLVATDERERNGKKFIFKEVFSEITPISFTQTIYQGEAGKDIRQLVNIHATKMTDGYSAGADLSGPLTALTKALEEDIERTKKTQKSSRTVAICALVVSAISLLTSFYFSWCARDHNRRSVRPLPFILQPNYEDRIAVIIQNKGTGPLILQKALAKTSPDGPSDHLIRLIPDPPRNIVFTNFNKVEQVRAIRPGDDVVLLDLTVDLNDPTAVTYRDQLRQALRGMTLDLTYSDIYDSLFPVYSWKLAHFSAPS